MKTPPNRAADRRTARVVTYCFEVPIRASLFIARVIEAAASNKVSSPKLAL